jgi:hypothetical protein
VNARDMIIEADLVTRILLAIRHLKIGAVNDRIVSLMIGD